MRTRTEQVTQTPVKREAESIPSSAPPAPKKSRIKVEFNPFFGQNVPAKRRLFEDLIEQEAVVAGPDPR